MAGGTMTLLHHLFQRNGIGIDEFYEKPAGVRSFMLASMKVQLEAERGFKNNGGSHTD